MEFVVLLWIASEISYLREYSLKTNCVVNHRIPYLAFYYHLYQWPCLLSNFSNMILYADDTNLVMVLLLQLMSVWLGILIIQFIANLVSKFSWILFRLKPYLNINIMLSLDNTLVLPHLMYCSLIGMNGYNLIQSKII